MAKKTHQIQRVKEVRKNSGIPIISWWGVPVGINKLGNGFSVFAKAVDIPYDPNILCLGILYQHLIPISPKHFYQNCQTATIQNSPRFTYIRRNT